MRHRPRNPNPALKNNNTLYLAVSGGGKSQALKQNTAIPKSGARVILWDQSGDHAGIHYEGWQSFLRALRAAEITNAKTGRGYRIAYAGPVTVARWEKFCEVVWAVLDGNKKTYVIAEELSAVCPGAGKATPNAAVLLNQGRKYGLEFHATSQKPQEVAKTYFDQCPIKYIGQQKGRAMCKKMAAELGITPEQVQALNELEFYRDEGTAAPPELLKLTYSGGGPVKWVHE